MSQELEQVDEAQQIQQRTGSGRGTDQERERAISTRAVTGTGSGERSTISISIMLEREREVSLVNFFCFVVSSLSLCQYPHSVRIVLHHLPKSRVSLDFSWALEF